MKDGLGGGGQEKCHVKWFGGGGVRADDRGLGRETDFEGHVSLSVTAVCAVRLNSRVRRVSRGPRSEP